MAHRLRLLELVSVEVETEHYDTDLILSHHVNCAKDGKDTSDIDIHTAARIIILPITIVLCGPMAGLDTDHAAAKLVNDECKPSAV